MTHLFRRFFRLTAAGAAIGIVWNYVDGRAWALNAATFEMAMVPDTYELEICKGECGPEGRPIRRGRMVMASAPLNWTGSTDKVRRQLH